MNHRWTLRIHNNAHYIAKGMSRESHGFFTARNILYHVFSFLNTNHRKAEVLINTLRGNEHQTWY